MIGQQIGNNNTQNLHLQTGDAWPSVPAQARADLVRELRKRGPEKFTVIRGFDNYSSAVAESMFDDLKRAGWGAEAFPKSTTIGVAASISMVMPTPNRPGITVYVKAPSPGLYYLVQWCQRVGLQNGTAGLLGLEADAPESARITFGDPPAP